MEAILKAIFESQGVWAFLAVFLIFYVLRTSEKREQQLRDTISENQKIIQTLSEKFSVLTEIRSDLEKLKEKFEK